MAAGDPSKQKTFLHGQPIDSHFRLHPGQNRSPLPPAIMTAHSVGIVQPSYVFKKGNFAGESITLPWKKASLTACDFSPTMAHKLMLKLMFNLRE
jgi:hypothetical protein